MVSVSTEASRSAVRRSAEREEIGQLPDDQLLDRFLGQDERAADAAFQVLVRRHGPMIMGVCRHVLGQVHDAEDAFQATFLVLARKASTIHDRRVLGRWLYEVAYRIAIRSRAHAARRRVHERQGAEMAAAVPRLEQDPGWSEVPPVLHEEVNRLPEKYRTAVVLCYLEGRTNEEAAELLQWPVGTVKGRLSRAREILRSRLTRRGMGLSAMFLITSLSRNTTFADVVPSQLVEETSRTAMLATRDGGSGAAAIPDRIVELAEGGATPASWSFLGIKMPALLAAVVIALGIVFQLTGGFSFGGWVAGSGNWNSLLPPASSVTGAAYSTGCHH